MLLSYDSLNKEEFVESNYDLEEDSEFQMWCREFAEDRAYDLNNYFPDEV